MMLKVGVTGGIGSGKSLVCKIIESMGFPVYHADVEAKKITDSHPRIIREVKNLFGEDIYLDGKLDRKRVADLVFVDIALLEDLNSIIHPIVAKDFAIWAIKNSNHSLVFQEAAILFESGAYKNMDCVIGVWAPEDIRIMRVISRDGITKQDVEQRIKHQLSEQELLTRCNFIIKNDEKELLVPQVDKVLKGLLESN